MKKQKKNNGMENILLSLPNEKKVELMHTIGMTHDNAHEIAYMGDILMQNGNPKEAYDLINRASGMNYAPATTRKGECLMVGYGCVAEPKVALKTFEQSAAQGDLWGTLAAAFIHHCGLWVERNDKKAEKFLAKVANNDLLTSQFYKADTKQLSNEQIHTQHEQEKR